MEDGKFKTRTAIPAVVGSLTANPQYRSARSSDRRRQLGVKDGNARCEHFLGRSTPDSGHADGHTGHFFVAPGDETTGNLN